MEQNYWARFSDMKKENSNEPILLIFPGMTGITEDGYVQNIVIEGIFKGYNVVIFKMRILDEDFMLNETFKLYDEIDETVDAIFLNYTMK